MRNKNPTTKPSHRTLFCIFLRFNHEAGKRSPWTTLLIKPAQAKNATLKPQWEPYPSLILILALKSGGHLLKDKVENCPLVVGHWIPLAEIHVAVDTRPSKLSSGGVRNCHIQNSSIFVGRVGDGGITKTNQKFHRYTTNGCRRKLIVF
jgi:hypothetical protein